MQMNSKLKKDTAPNQKCWPMVISSMPCTQENKKRTGGWAAEDKGRPCTSALSLSHHVISFAGEEIGTAGLSL